MSEAYFMPGNNGWYVGGKLVLYAFCVDYTYMPCRLRRHARVGFAGMPVSASQACPCSTRNSGRSLI